MSMFFQWILRKMRILFRAKSMPAHAPVVDVIRREVYDQMRNQLEQHGQTTPFQFEYHNEETEESYSFDSSPFELSEFSVGCREVIICSWEKTRIEEKWKFREAEAKETYSTIQIKVFGMFLAVKQTADGSYQPKLIKKEDDTAQFLVQVIRGQRIMITIQSKVNPKWSIAYQLEGKEYQLTFEKLRQPIIYKLSGRPAGPTLPTQLIPVKPQPPQQNKALTFYDTSKPKSTTKTFTIIGGL
eukprot:m.306343 g.306343  ORF g.306343 m.306343 type:complete len:242 (+) comp41166_c0_seq1:500-1225(+)